MSRKIIGITVGTPMKPQAVVDKSTQAEQIVENEQAIDKHIKDGSVHVTPEEKQTWSNKSDFSGNYNDLINKPNIPSKASDIGAEVSGTAQSKVSEHNTNTDSHNDIRLLIQGLTTRLNALANSDDTTLDQMAEIVAYIKANRTVLQSVTASKVNVTDIIDNLITNVSDKPLAAAMGVTLKELIDALQTAVTNHTSDNDIHITAGERTSWNEMLDAPKSIKMNGETLIRDRNKTVDLGNVLHGVVTGEPANRHIELDGDYDETVPVMTNGKLHSHTIPDEFVTESELTAKGYAKQTEVTQLSEEIADLKASGIIVVQNGNTLTIEGSEE